MISTRAESALRDHPSSCLGCKRQPSTAARNSSAGGQRDSGCCGPLRISATAVWSRTQSLKRAAIPCMSSDSVALAASSKLPAPSCSDAVRSCA